MTWRTTSACHQIAQKQNDQFCDFIYFFWEIKLGKSVTDYNVDLFRKLCLLYEKFLGTFS